MKKKNRAAQFLLLLAIGIIAVLVVFPFWLLISASVSNGEVLMKQGYQIWPNPFDFSAYQYIFKNPDTILRAYGVTAVYSVVSMVLSTLLMAMVAYPLTRSGLKGRSQINFYLYFTTLFGGGLVPSYLLIAKFFHMNDTMWVYIIPGLISPWYVFMMKTSFKTGVPNEIIEAATIDGASEYKIFFQMILPLSKPVIATVALMVFLAHWNNWNTALIYITDPKLYSLQYLLQKIMEDINTLKMNAQAGIDLGGIEIPSETIRMAMAMVVAGPALLVFPFFQKYFVKGLTVGSVKG
ncbi:MAG: carbohydrate ABC transporter permease [Clostridia bacterium]|nr:carbohydrate ABC transporter permease [Clostridia bacterium]